MNTPEAPTSTDDNDDGPDYFSLKMSAGFLVVFVALSLATQSVQNSSLVVAFLLSEVTLISVVIWQACDPFADAAQWVGQKLNLPGSVRGATLDAIASSMPELFSGIFFVVLAVTAARHGTSEEIIAAGAEGYGSTIATCAGSAVYNMILIPAFCALVISFSRKSRPTIDVEDEVIARDGLWFVACELLLILFLFQSTMQWWMGFVFLMMYALYIFQLSRDAMIYRQRKKVIANFLAEYRGEREVATVHAALAEQGHRVPKVLVMHALELAGNEDADDEEETDSAGVFFGFWDVPLTKTSAWLVIIISTIVAAAACYFLVDATLETASHLGVPTFFVAVILAAAASSVPDTFLAIGAAKRGDDSGAVSNAFGSNIFDICICLSIPLFVNSYLTGWEPVRLLQDGKPIPGLMGLRILLVVLTIVTLLIMWHNRQLTRNKALSLCGLYLVFIAYAVLGSLGVLF